MYYSFICDHCDYVFEVQQSIMDSNHKADCPDCMREARRVFLPIPFRFDFWFGQDDGLGAYVDTKKDRERIMREKDLERITD